eukprot:3162653-Pleurochrysis_carterae.AAC.1
MSQSGGVIEGSEAIDARCMLSKGWVRSFCGVDGSPILAARPVRGVLAEAVVARVLPHASDEVVHLRKANQKVGTTANSSCGVPFALLSLLPSGLSCQEYVLRRCKLRLPP